MNSTMGQLTQLNTGAGSFPLLLTHMALLAIVCAGLLFMIGARRLGFRVLIFAIISAAIAGFREDTFASILEFVRQLPSWGQLFLAVIIVLGLLRFLLTPFLGREAAAGAVGSLAAEAISFIFRMAFLPLRIVQRLIQNR